MNSSGKTAAPPVDGRAGIDRRPLVLLILGLIVLLSGLVNRLSPAGLRQEYRYLWLAGSQTKAGLYRLPRATPLTALYRGLGLKAPAGRADEWSAALSTGRPQLAALRIEDNSWPEVIPLPVEVTPFFFLPLPINRADKDILATLPGIGPQLAERIIAARDRQGGFHRPADLLQVKGIGPLKLKKVQKLLSFD